MGRLRAKYNSIFQYNRHGRDEWVARQASELAPGSRVLDVGAGSGPYRHLLAHCDYKAHDFGAEPGTVGRYTALDYESDILAIPAPDAGFDAILCTEVLEHVPEPIAAVRELARLLRVDGVLLLSAPLGSLLHQEPYHFYGGFTPWWYRKFLPEAGCAVVAIEPNGGFFQWFGQEAMRFFTTLHPKSTRDLTAGRRLAVTLVWVITLPFCRVLLPVVGRWLDGLQLEHAGTAGYHVVARRVPSGHTGASA